MTGAVIDRFRVHWRLGDPGLRDEAAALLDALRDVLDQALAGLVAPDEQVAIDALRVPPVRLRAGRTGEAADAWAHQVAAAVTEHLAAGGAAVVRHPSRSAALLDLTLRACAGDTSLHWAWRQLGLWPAATPAAEGADGVTAALAAQPGAVAPVFAAVARHGALQRLVALLGVTRLEGLAAVAWQAVGGTPPDLPGAAAERDIPGPTGPRPRPAGPSPHSGPGGSASSPADITALLSGSPLGSAARTADDARARAALTALALVDADPGRVAGDGAALLGRVLPTRAAEQPGPPSSAEGGELEPAAPPPAGSSGAGRPRTVPAGELRTVPAVTAHAGLLFCLHVTGPETWRTRPGPTPGSRLSDLGVRRTMHLLGGELLRRSAPRLPCPDPTDPALRAFCGLPPSAAPPGPPGPPGDEDPAAVRHAVCGLADDTVRTLRQVLSGRPPARLTDTALLAHVLHRRGEITSAPGWLDVRLDLDDVSVDLRAVGLDLDPGWLPALGCIVRFRYV